MEETDLKTYWRMMNILSQKNEVDMDALKRIFIDEMKQTSLIRLANRYKRFSIISFIFSFVGIFFVQMPIFDSQMRYVLCIALMLYFMTASCMDYFLYNRIKSIEISLMTTSEVLEKVISTRKLHFIFMLILLPMASGLVTLLILAFPSDSEIIWGFCAGAIIGLGIGIMKLIDFLKDYKNIISR